MRSKEKEIAITLRKNGSTFREISEKIDVSKSLLSVWLRDIPFPKKYISRVKNLKDRAREMSALTMKKLWADKHSSILKSYKPPYSDAFFMLGLGIYMGEGAKYSRNHTSLANSDAKILLIFISWMKKFFIKEDLYLGAKVHIHSNIDSDKAVGYWSRKLKIKKSNFTKTIVAVSRSSKGKRNTLNYGTCNVVLKGKNNWIVAAKIRKAMEDCPISVTG